MALEKKLNFNHFLVCSCLHLSYILVYVFFPPLNFSNMIAMEERRRFILLLESYIILYMLAKLVMDIQALILQGEWEKFAILSLVYGSMGHI